MKSRSWLLWKVLWLSVCLPGLIVGSSNSTRAGLLIGYGGSLGMAYESSDTGPFLIGGWGGDEIFTSGAWAYADHGNVGAFASIGEDAANWLSGASSGANFTDTLRIDGIGSNVPVRLNFIVSGEKYGLASASLSVQLADQVQEVRDTLTSGHYSFPFTAPVGGLFNVSVMLSCNASRDPNDLGARSYASFLHTAAIDISNPIELPEGYTITSVNGTPVTPIPEPTGLVLLGLGVVALVAWRRRGPAAKSS